MQDTGYDMVTCTQDSVTVHMIPGPETLVIREQDSYVCSRLAKQLQKLSLLGHSRPAQSAVGTSPVCVLLSVVLQLHFSSPRFAVGHSTMVLERSLLQSGTRRI